MTFLVTAALGLLALVIGPLAAHLLRRRQDESTLFPAVQLVEPAPIASRRRAGPDDRWLLLVRLLLIAALALLAATPLLRWQRLGLQRDGGTSVAVALVLDDSLSMAAATPEGTTRWALAKAGALELLSSLRPEDAVTVILAGAPPRVVVPLGADADAARALLEDFTVSHRETELQQALRLAEQELRRLPYQDRQIILLSDLADDELAPVAYPLSLPVESLRQPLRNCGIAHAEPRGRQLVVEVACSSQNAAEGRTLELLGPEGGSQVSQPLATQGGSQLLEFLAEPPEGARVRITGKDAIAVDNESLVLPQATERAIGIVSLTPNGDGGRHSMLNQAIQAVAPALPVRPLATVPETPEQWSELQLLLVDDPAGFPVEERQALERWLRNGGSAVLLAGPSANDALLGSGFAPFLEAAPPWSQLATPMKVSRASLAWLGSDADSLSAPMPKGRADLRGAVGANDVTVLGTWEDGWPFLLVRRVGLGSAWVLALPSTIDWSDVTLRPGFLAWLQYLLDEAARQDTRSHVVVGQSWEFTSPQPPEVTGPEGEVPVLPLGGTPARWSAAPAVQGTYHIRLPGQPEEIRHATLSSQEIARHPTAPPKTGFAGRGATEQWWDASELVAALAAALLAAELALRFWKRRQGLLADGPAAERLSSVTERLSQLSRLSRSQRD